MKKVILTTGGTGGHIYPALAIGDELKEQNVDVLFVGTCIRMEKDIVPNAGYRFIGLELYPISSLKGVISLVKCIFKGFKIVKKENPDAIIAFGNYISLPILIGGILNRKKIYIQEQNATIGLANRVFFGFCKKIFLAFESSYDELPLKYEDRIVVTGNPLRKEIINIKRDEERELLKVDVDEKVLLVTGGSLGAQEINDAVITSWNKIYSNKNLRLYWATGEKHYQDINKKIDKDRIKTKDVIKPYFENMINIMAAADLVICRAGALTISELIELEKPSILIPYKYKKVGQVENAKVLEEVEATEVYTGDKAEEVIEKALKLLEDPTRLEEMKIKIRSLKQKNAAKEIVAALDIWRD